MSLQTCMATVLVLANAGCGGDDPTVVAAKRFAGAVMARDAEMVIESIDASSQEVLQTAAERATDQIGGRRTIAVEEVLQVVDVDSRFEVREATLVQKSDTAATVELTAANRTSHRVHLVLEDGQWKVHLPLASSESRPR